jgi:hypothetical protein
MKLSVRVLTPSTLMHSTKLWVCPSKRRAIVPSTAVPFILASSFSHSTRLSSCTSCCMKASAWSQPKERVRSRVGAAPGPNWSLKKSDWRASGMHSCGSSSGEVGMW